MGTSTNQASPRTPSWGLVQAILGDPQVLVERQSQEIWRAAATDREGRLVADLGSSLLAVACGIASERTDPATAVGNFELFLLRERGFGLALDIAKRALARAAASGSGAPGFGAELFAEVISYYASRDLPGLVGSRLPTTSSSIRLKEQLRGIARRAAAAVDPPSSSPDMWRTFVGSVLASLQG